MFPCVDNKNINYSYMFGFPNLNIQTERKRSFPSLNHYPFCNIEENFQFSCQSSNNVNKHRKKKKSSYSSCSTQKESIDSTSNKKNNLFNTGNINKTDFNTNQYEIDEFNSFLSSLPSEVSDFLCTQKGAREIYKTIQRLSQECKTVLITRLGTNLVKVMIDIYGNYSCQQLIQSSSPEQITLMLQYIHQHFVKIAKDYSGTHVLQALLDVLSSKEQEKLILSSIKSSELEMAYDINATHVLQKIVVTIPEERRSELNQVILSSLKPLSLNPNGICLVKKFIGSSKGKNNRSQITKIMSKNCVEISQSPYGNYAMQYILDEWGVESCASIVKSIIDNVCALSVQKYSSNVSEKIIELLDDVKKSMCFKQLFFSSKVLSVIKNKYGRYVLQKAIKYMTVEQKKEIKEQLMSINVTSQKEKNRLKSFLSFLEG